MNISDKYLELFTCWRDEFERTDLTKFTDAQYTQVQNYIESFKKSSLKFTEPVQKDVVKSYIDNLEFLLEDLLKIRKVKILNLALSLNDIDFDKLTEAEKLLYENSVIAVKSYNKLKNIALLDGTILKSLESAQPDTEIDEISTHNGHTPSDLLGHDTTEEVIEKEESISYLLIRFLKKTPPLVGLDLINYGPFEKEDIALIPLENAKILISENQAEVIEL